MVSVSGIVATGLELAIGQLGLGSILGVFGPVIFQVSQDKVKTWEQLRRSVEASYADHEVINQKPVSEFTGPGLDEIEFTIVLNGCVGADPGSDMEMLRTMMTFGLPLPLLLGGAVMGRFTIRQLDETWRYAPRGHPLVIALSMTIKEYVETVPTSSQGKQQEDQARRGETGKGGPERLPGSGTPSQPRSLTPKIDPNTRMVTSGPGASGNASVFDSDM